MNKNIFKQNNPEFDMQKKRGDVFSKSIKGQGLSVNAIILIILGLVVLVILILGFTIGWNRILPFVKTNNIQNIVTACENACTTRAQFDFCEASREVSDGVVDKFPSTCKDLSTKSEYAKYGIGACPGLCPAPPTPPAP